MKASLFDPPIPYVWPISGSRFYFSPGKLIRIEGVTPSNAERFDVNLQCGPETTATDIAIQISVRLLDRYISVNSLRAGTWGEEWRGFTLPIKRTETFEIAVECDFDQYKIVIDGQPYGEFPQRIRYDRITHLIINGDVSVKKIFYESASKSAVKAAFISRFAGISRSPAFTSVSLGDTDKLKETDTATANISSPKADFSGSFSRIVDSLNKATVDDSDQSPDSKKVCDSTTVEEVKDTFPCLPTDVQIFLNPASTKFQPRLQPVSNFSGNKVGVGCAIIVTFVIIVATLIVKTAIQEQ